MQREREDDDVESRESDRLNMHLRADGSYDFGLQEIGKKILSTTPTAPAGPQLKMFPAPAAGDGCHFSSKIKDC